MATKSTLIGKKRKKIVKISLIISFLFIGFIGYGIYWAFFDMNRLPTGEYLTEEMSPVGRECSFIAVIRFLDMYSFVPLYF